MLFLLRVEDERPRPHFVLDVALAILEVAGPRLQFLLDCELVAHRFEQQLRFDQFDDVQQVKIGGFERQLVFQLLVCDLRHRQEVR